MKQGPLRAFAAFAALALVPLGAGGGGRLRAQVVVFVGPQATAIPIANVLDTVTVPIVADVTGAGGAALGAITAQLSWRAGTLRFLGAGAGAVGVPVLNVDSANGTVRFALATAGGVSGLPVLMQARFQAIGPLGDSTTLAVAVSELTAAGTFAALTPATTAALVCVGAVAGRWGDLTGDDLVMSNDALAIVTYAVGLPIAPLTPLNGDVDADGVVHTRDALIVLSFVVGLPTPGFRVNQPRPGACGSGSPVATVAVSPGTATLVPGDQLPLAVIVHDTGGAIVHANPAWLTRNAAVATVDRAGVVQAVGAGTTRIVVAAVPGIMDSTTVTVGGTRRVWYVNAGATGVENGSPQFPFATIPQAVLAAAPDDTIRLAVGTYGSGLHLTGPLVVLGDSNALGFPTILPVDTAPAVTIDGLVSGDLVAIRRLRVADAAQGVRAHGAGGVLELDRVIVERTRGAGIRVTALDTARLDAVAVLGAVELGIAADSLRLLWMTRVTSDGVAPGSSGQSYSLKTSQLDSLLADSVDLRSAAALVDATASVTLTHSFVGFVDDRVFLARGAVDVRIDTVTFMFARQGVALVMAPGGAVALNRVTVEATDSNGLHVAGRTTVTARDLFVRGPNQAPLPGALPAHAAKFTFSTAVTIAQSRFEGGTVEFLDTLLSPTATVRLDTVTLMDANLLAQTLARLDLRQVDMHGAAYTMVQANNIGVVHLAGVEAEENNWQPPTFQSFGPFAIDLLGVDSVRADSLSVHDNWHGGLRAEAVRVLTSYGSRFERNNTQPFAGSPTTIYLNGLQSGRLAQAIIDERVGPYFRYSVYWATSVSSRGLVVDTTTFLGPYLGVFATGGAGLLDTLVVRGSAFRLAGGYVGGRAAQSSSLDHTAYLNNTVDSLLGAAQLSANGIAAEARGNVLNEVEYGIELITAPGGSDFVGNQVSCVYPATYGNAIRATVRPDSVVGNTITGCRFGVELINTGAGAIGPSVLRGNIIVTDTIPSSGIEVRGFWRNLEIVGNDFGGPGRYGSGAINLDAQFGTYDIDSARVDSNLIHDGFGSGIRTTFGTRRFRMRGNTVERRGQTSISDAGILVDGGAVSDTNRITDNRIRQNRTLGIYLNTGAPTRVDSTVVVDDSTTALFVQTAGRVVGTSNFLARNRVGIQNTGIINLSQSVIQQHDTVGARGGGSITLANNWWGDLTGPRCGALCPGALGDSVTVAVAFSPFLTSPPSTPTGAPPVRPVAGLPQPARAALAGATRTVAPQRAAPPQAPRAAPRPQRGVRLPTGEVRPLTGGER